MSAIEVLREELLKVEYKGLTNEEVLKKLNDPVIDKPPDPVVVEDKITKLQELKVSGRIGPTDIEKARA